MAFGDLRNLYRLHLIDLAILEIRKRAAALDPGRALAAEIKQLEAQLNELGGAARTHHAEIADLDLKIKAAEDKRKSVNHQLYGGNVVNPREVENFQKEIAHQDKLKGELEDKMLALMDNVPAGAENVPKLEEALKIRKRQLAEKHKEALEQKAKLEEDYKFKNIERPRAAEAVPAPMLARYEAIRKKLDGVGMTDVNGTSCASCGTLLPEKIIEGARDGRLVTCESCHRLVYASEGLI